MQIVGVIDDIREGPLDTEARCAMYMPYETHPFNILSVVARTSVPSPSSAIAAPWSAWLGGVLGAAYAVAVVMLARPLGAATLTALVVTGQLVCSVVLDHFGLLGFELHAASVGRVIGCALLVVGIALIWRF